MATRSTVNGKENLYESVEELRLKLETMKKMMDADEDDDEEEMQRSRKKTRYSQSIIDGSFLSVVFIVVLILIICVSFYAFSNLYYAVLKKFPSRKHSEL